MISNEEYIRNVIEISVRNAVQTLLRTREFSKFFLIRDDIKEVDKEIARLSIEITQVFVTKLKDRGYLEEGLDISEEAFEALLNTTIKDYFGEKSESGSK
jgi:hypothetical protein